MSRAEQLELFLYEVKDLVEEENKFVNEMPSWNLTITVPAAAGEEFWVNFFEHISDAAFEFEEKFSFNKKDWDLFIFSSKAHGMIPTWQLTKVMNDL